MKPVQEVLSEYQAQPRERGRIAYLEKHAQPLFPLLDNLNDPECMTSLNNHLVQRGHPELTFEQTAEMPPLEFVPNPLDQNHLGLFAAGFMMTTYSETTGERVPISTSNLLETMRCSIDLRSLRTYKDHRARPAFYRAICADAGFIINLTADISSGEKPLKIFGPEIFLAYRIMSRLIDRRDPGAVKQNGRDNRDYILKKKLPLTA